MISVVKDGVLTAQQPLWTSGAILLLGSGLLAGGMLWRRAQKRAGDATFLRKLRARVLILVGPMLIFGAFATFTYQLRVGPEGVALHSFGFSTNAITWNDVRKVTYTHSEHRSVKGRRRVTERLRFDGEQRYLRLSVAELDDEQLQELGRIVIRHVSPKALPMPPNDWLIMLEKRPLTEE